MGTQFLIGTRTMKFLVVLALVAAAYAEPEAEANAEAEPWWYSNYGYASPYYAGYRYGYSPYYNWGGYRYLWKREAEPSPRLTPKPSHGGTATTATGTGDTPALTGTGGDTPTAHTTTGEATATCGRETPRLSLRPRPTPRLTGTETGTAGGGEAGDTDTGPTATDTTAAGGVGRPIQLTA